MVATDINIHGKERVKLRHKDVGTVCQCLFYITLTSLYGLVSIEQLPSLWPAVNTHIVLKIQYGDMFSYAIIVIIRICGGLLL